MASGEIEALVNSVARFIHLVACQTARNAPVVKYLNKAVAALKLLKPALDGVIDSPSYVAGYGEELDGLFEELDALVDEAREVVEKHAQRMSITRNVLQCEPLEIKIQNSSMEICRILGESLQPDAPTSLRSSIQRCIQGLECSNHGNAPSRLMELCLKDQREFGISSPDNIIRIAESLGLTSTEQLFKERIALEKDKARMEAQPTRSPRGDDAGVIEQLIELVRGIGSCLEKREKQDGGMSIPPYFRCPLSSELMLDPVILASGQTFERCFIRRWLDSGLGICPVTRHALAHTNLVPNYTVKALIANWCQENGARLTSETSFHGAGGSALRRPSEAGDRAQVSTQTIVEHEGEEGSSCEAAFSREDDPIPRGHSRSESASSANSALVVARRSMSDDRAAAARAAAPFSSPWSQGTCGSSSYGEDETGRTPSRSMGFGGWDEAADYALVERLLDDLRNGGDLSSEDEKARRAAAALELRLLAKNNRENRLLIARCGCIPPLVAILRTPVDEDEAKEVNRFYEETEENAVTALLNLSIEERNKRAVVEAGGVEPLVRVLRCGMSAAARENAAAALASLAAVEVHKTSIGRCAGAIRGLVDLLGGGPRGTARGKKDAATALFSLSIVQENKARIVQAGAPSHLLEFLADGGGQEGGGGMADKAAALLANLSTIEEGRAAIVQAGGIPLLVEVVETGSHKGKENAAATLLQLCMSSQTRCALVLQEGAVPPLIGLSQLGTPRAREKAQQILSQFRCQRQEGAMGRRRS